MKIGAMQNTTNSAQMRRTKFVGGTGGAGGSSLKQGGNGGTGQGPKVTQQQASKFAVYDGTGGAGGHGNQTGGNTGLSEGQEVTSGGLSLQQGGNINTNQEPQVTQQQPDIIHGYTGRAGNYAFPRGGDGGVGARPESKDSPAKGGKY
ncbi:hypothetical protein C8R44DRAFT_881900 [Mycena epipterygia]|nr:hypothetical protein C8R44DRAFT_881900 [Mycena epipterygia]